ncbi:MAG TPA: tRNA 2-selenouridine(34) synthase MnmH [Planctomycetes bacterium]|nr:tRNA 2-selenouridine(34) synthase MnmH [Planctomycetota bacterium]
MLPAFSFQSLKKRKNLRWIDLRSPSEYAVDHVPWAQNVPLFDDEQRAVVGTLYKQHSPGEAYLEGLKIIEQRLPDLLKQVLGQSIDSDLLKSNFDILAQNLRGGVESTPIDVNQALTDDTELVVYCWRGGMRSRSFVSLLIALGIRAVLLEGGYKSYRQWVMDSLHTYPYPAAIVLRGRTGVGKTNLLADIEAVVPNSTICLESLANHRSSALGAVGRCPVSQKRFESMLLQRLFELEDGPAFIEGESRKVGDVVIPQGLFDKMTNGTQVKIEASRPYRRQTLQEDYLAKPDANQQIAAALPFLEARIGAKWVGELQALLANENHDALVDVLLDHYYDPLYDREDKKYHWDDELHRDSAQILENLITIYSRITA